MGFLGFRVFRIFKLKGVESLRSLGFKVFRVWALGFGVSRVNSSLVLAGRLEHRNTPSRVSLDRCTVGTLHSLAFYPSSRHSSR